MLTAPRSATAMEARILEARGFRPVRVQGASGWWIGTGDPVTTDEALLACVEALDAERDKPAAPPGGAQPPLAPGWRTSEGWLVAAVALPAMAAAVEAMRGGVDALPPPWGAVAGMVLAGLAAGLVAAYAAVRGRLKAPPR